MKPLLSICIPTYNRSSYLKRTIDSIVCQEEFLNKEVELVISDNASTDDTKEICRFYCDKYENFYYFCNETNIMDQNFPLSLSRAHGKIRKINNDTFILKEYSLKYLCNKIRNSSEDTFLYFLNEDKDFQRELSFESFVCEVNYKLTWISSFMFWEKDCEGIENKIDGCELKLWQVKRMLEFASNYNKIQIIAKELGKSILPQKKDLSYGVFVVFHDNFLHILEEYVYNGKLKKSTLEQIEKILLFDFFEHWLIHLKLYKSNYIFSKEEDFKNLVKRNYKDKPYWKTFKRQFRWDYIKSVIKKVLRIQN